MKIAIDCRLIGQSGIGTFIENVLECLIKDYHHDYILIGKKEALSKYISYKNCKIIICNYGSFTLKELFAFPVKEVNKCDAFFTPNFNLPAGIKIPIFSTIHDIVFFDIDIYTSKIKKAIIKWYMKRAIRSSKTIFTVSEFTKKRIKEFFQTERNIQVVYSAINKDLERYAQNKHIAKSDRNGIVFLGNLKKQKGLHTLIEALNILRQKNIEKKLTIIGNMNFRSKDEGILEFINQNKDNITLISGANNQKVYDLISHAELLVSPSLYEGFGLAPLEAMYLGTPCIISDIDVYREIYNSFPVTYFHVGDANALAQLIGQFKYKTTEEQNNIDRHYNFKTITTPRIIHIIENMQ